MLAQIITENGQKKIQALTADTGTGAPVGSIIVVCSNILPSGYLGLGVQYDPTNYPALYQVLGTDTTPTASALGLPTLSSGQYAIKATSGLTENQQENVLNTINENNSYSTEEHFTGKRWHNGKKIYEKVITGLALSGVKTDLTNTGITITNLEEITNSISYRANPNGIISGNSYFVSEGGAILYLSQSGQAISKISFEYTKTTD